MSIRKILLILICIMMIAGVFGVLRDLFLKEYEEDYHFWISVIQGSIQGVVTLPLILFVFRKKESDH